MTSFAQLHRASAHHMPMVDSGSVQACITSPPYFGLRKYDGEQDIEWPEVTYSPMAGLEPITVAGCDPECEHEWADLPARRTNGNTDETYSDKQKSNQGAVRVVTQGAYCQKCGGWRGPLGNEPTIEAYIAHLILCAREWRRVLRDDGTLWVNLGDTYHNSTFIREKSTDGFTNKGDGEAYDNYYAQNGGGVSGGKRRSTTGMKIKNLLMVPARFALAMQADGWILRSEIVWAKPNPMPESVTDRPTKAHEMVYLFSKRERYFWDLESVRLPPAPGNDGTIRARARTADGPLGGLNQHNIAERRYDVIKGANLRSVLTVATPKVTLRDDLDAETRARVIAQLVERGLL